MKLLAWTLKFIGIAVGIAIGYEYNEAGFGWFWPLLLGLGIFASAGMTAVVLEHDESFNPAAVLLVGPMSLFSNVTPVFLGAWLQQDLGWYWVFSLLATAASFAVLQSAQLRVMLWLSKMSVEEEQQ